MTSPDAGAPAPAFSLPTDTSETVSLSDLAGKAVVLFFYPKDDTSGCTKEAVAFSRLKPAFDAANCVVIGISRDSVKSHAKFRAKHDLTVLLAADEDTAVTAAYGAWVEKSMYGRKYMGTERSTFLIGSDGIIKQVWRKVKVPGHAEAVLAAAQAL